MKYHRQGGVDSNAAPGFGGSGNSAPGPKHRQGGVQKSGKGGKSKAGGRAMRSKSVSGPGRPKNAGHGY